MDNESGYLFLHFVNIAAVGLDLLHELHKDDKHANNKRDLVEVLIQRPEIILNKAMQIRPLLVPFIKMTQLDTKNCCLYLIQSAGKS